MAELEELQKITKYLELILSKDGFFANKLTNDEQTKIYGKVLKENGN